MYIREKNWVKGYIRELHLHCWKNNYREYNISYSRTAAYFLFVTQTYQMFRYWEKGKMFLEYNLALTLHERNILLFPKNFYIHAKIS